MFRNLFPIQEKFNQYYLNPETNAWEDKCDLIFDTTTIADHITTEVKWWEYTEDFQNGTGSFNTNSNKGKIALSVKEDQGRKLRKWARNHKGESKGYFYSLYSTRSRPQLAKYRYLAWHLSDSNYPETVEQFMALHKNKKEASHSFWNNLSIVKCENEYQLHYSNKEDELIVNVTPDLKSYPGDNNFLKRQLKWENKILARIHRNQSLLYSEAKKNISKRLDGMKQAQIDSFVRKKAIRISDVEQLINSRKTKLPNAKLPYKARIPVLTFGVHNIDAPVAYFIYGAGNILTSPYWLFRASRKRLMKVKMKKYNKKKRLGFAFIDTEPRNLETIRKITVIQKGNNTTREFKDDKLGRIEFSDAYENLGIVFFKDGNSRIIPPKQFKGYSINSGSFKFETIQVDSKGELKNKIKELGFEI